MAASGAEPIVLTGADLSIADVEAVARHGTDGDPRRDRARPDAGVARPDRAAGRGRRGRLWRDDRVRGARHPVHRAGRRRAAPGEPPDEPRRRGRRAARHGDRPGDAPPPGEHPGARPQRLPARARRPPAHLPGARHPPDRAGAGFRWGVRRSRAAGPPCPALDRAWPGRAQRTTLAGPRRPSRGGPRAARPPGKGRAGTPQRDAADDRDRGAVARGCGPAGGHGQRRGGDQRRGAPGHGRRLLRGLPARSPAPRPDRGRRRAPPSPPRLLGPDRPPRRRPQGPGSVLAPVRAPGPRRRPRRARPPPSSPRHRDEQRDRQPARLPRGRRRGRGCPGDRRRPGDQRRQLPWRAGRPCPRLRQDRDRRARLDQRAADVAAPRPTSEWRVARVPRRPERAGFRA